MKSVLLALRLIEDVAALQPVSVADLTRRHGLPKSTVQRSLQTLATAGWICRDGGHVTRWMLTTKALDVGANAANGPGMRDLAMPTMRRLHEMTNENIHLSIPDGDEAVLIECIESTQTLRTVFPLGYRTPMYSSGAGKVMLAHLPVHRQETIVHGELHAFTPRTFANPTELTAELRRIRDNGYAINRGERDEGTSSVGVAILDRQGYSIGAITISVPTQRFSESKAEEFRELVLAAAISVNARTSSV